MQWLPDDVFGLILANLNEKELFSLCQVSQSIRTKASQNKFWKKLALDQVGKQIESVSKQERDEYFYIHHAPEGYFKRRYILTSRFSKLFGNNKEITNSTTSLIVAMETHNSIVYYATRDGLVSSFHSKTPSQNLWSQKLNSRPVVGLILYEHIPTEMDVDLQSQTQAPQSPKRKRDENEKQTNITQNKKTHILVVVTQRELIGFKIPTMEKVYSVQFDDSVATYSLVGKDMIAVVPGRYMLQYFSLIDGQEKKSAPFRQNSVATLAIDSKRNKMIVGTTDGILKLCEIEDGKQLLSHQGHSKSVNRLVILNDLLVSFSTDNSCLFFDLQTNKLISRCMVSNWVETCFVWQEFLVVGCADGSVSILDLILHKQMKQFKIENDFRGIKNTVISSICMCPVSLSLFIATAAPIEPYKILRIK